MSKLKFLSPVITTELGQTNNSNHTTQFPQLILKYFRNFKHKKFPLSTKIKTIPLLIGTQVALILQNQLTELKQPSMLQASLIFLLRAGRKKTAFSSQKSTC